MRWKTIPPVGAAGLKARAFMDGTWGGSFHPDFQPQPETLGRAKAAV